MILASLSGWFLHHRLKFKVTIGSRLTPLASIIIGVGLAYLLPDYGKAIIFFSAAIAQFISFVFVSNLRQRGSFFWHAVAAVASNGTWYATMHLFDDARANWIYLFPFIAGVAAGRTIGVLWAQYVVKRFDLKADATRDDKLAPGKRLRYIAREPTFWVLFSALIGYTLYGLIYFDVALKNGLMVIVGLSILQNLFTSMKARAQNRGNNNYIVAIELLGGTIFYVNAVYLFSVHLPIELSLPYILSTVLGSTLGAFFSMIIERKADIAPDRHLEKKAQVKQSKLPYTIFAALSATWILANESILNYLGVNVQSLAFPLPIPGMDDLPRMVIMLIAAIIFFLDSFLHTATSRAGNRNHTGYHVSACIPKGLVDFCKMGYFALNPRIPDIVPIAILVGCLGSLFGKDISQRIEKWLDARMDAAEGKTSALATVVIAQK